MRYAIFVLLVTRSLAPGQTFTGTIQGNVTDSTGAVVAGVQLRAMNEDTGLRRTEASNATGDYLFASLPPGRYRVEAALAGFKQESVRGVVLQVNQKVRIDLVLKPGDVSETVEVTGAAPLVNTSDATVGQVIDQQKGGRAAAQRPQLPAACHADLRRGTAPDDAWFAGGKRNAGKRVGFSVRRCRRQ